MLIALFVQTTFAQFMVFHGAVPSLVTIAVVLYAAKLGARRGALFGLIAGLLEDCFAGTAGAWTIATTVTALAVGGISRTFFSDGFAMLGALVAIAVLLRDRYEEKPGRPLQQHDGEEDDADRQRGDDDRRRCGDLSGLARSFHH